jgi:hypothetical protein
MIVKIIAKEYNTILPSRTKGVIQKAPTNPSSLDLQAIPLVLLLFYLSFSLS